MRTERPSFVAVRDAWTGRLFNDPLSIPLTRVLARWNVHPNAITILSLAIAMVAAYLFYLGDRRSLLVGAVVWHIGFIFDGVDGMVARATGKTSKFGARLDAACDKVKKAVALVCLFISQSGGVGLFLVLTLHYALHYVRVPRARELDAWLSKKGITRLFDPLDEQFFMLFVGPLLGFPDVFIIIAFALQLVDLGVNFALTVRSNDRGFA